METTISGIPTLQQRGDANIVKSKTFKTDLQAEEVYLRTMQRLLNVNRWNSFDNIGKGKYQLMNAQAGIKLQNAAEGDLILYKTEGREMTTSEWFRIERIITKLHVHDRSISMILRPVQVTGLGEQTTYSFSTDSTITLSVQLNNSAVSVGAYAKTNETAAAASGENGSMLSTLKSTLSRVFNFGGQSRNRWVALAEGLMH